MTRSAPFARSLALFAPALALASGCGSELEGRLWDGLTTTLAPPIITAGTSSQVLCALERGEQWVAPSDYAARLVPETGPANGASVTGLTATGTRAGTYRVHCEIPKYRALDEVGAVLTITAGAPVKTRPAFSQNPVEAGTVVSTECVGVDEYGNEVPVAGATFDIPEGLVFTGTEIRTNLAGAFVVECGIPSLPREPVTLTVLPADPVRVELTATPARAGYAPGAAVTLDWTAYDRFDNPIEDLPGELTTPTAPRLTTVDANIHKYRLEEEGRYRFSVRLDEPWQSLTDDLELLVDVTPPELLIEFPPRGATLDAGDGPVVVRGRLIDAGGFDPARVLTINGRPVSVGADGKFSHEVESKWGVNVLNFFAEDTAGNVADKSPSYGYSDGWLSFIDQDARGLQQPDGLVVLLGQDFFDDGVHDPAKLDDIATVFEVLLKSLDVRTPLQQALSGVNQLIPLVNQQQRVDVIPDVSWIDLTFVGNLAITLEAAESTGLGPVAVGIDSRTGGLDFDIEIGTDTIPAFSLDLVFKVSLTFEVLANGCSPFGCVPLSSGTALGEAVVTSSLDLGDFDVFMAVEADKDYQQPMQLSVSELTSNVGNFALQPIEDVTLNIVISGIQGLPNTNFSLPLSQFIDLGALFSGILDPIANAGGALITGALNPLIQAFVGPILSGLFDLLVLDTVLPIPNLLGGDPVEIGFSTELSTVDFTDDGGTIGLATGIHSEKGIDFDELGRPGDPHEMDPEGAILRGDCLGMSTSELAWEWDPSIGIGVRVDVLNSAFYAAWWTGALNAPLDLSALGGGGAIPIPIDGLSLELEWLLPPMLNDCTKGSLQAQIGDLFIVMRGNALGAEVEVEMYADLGLAMEFVSYDGSDGGPRGLSLRFGQIVYSDIEIAALEDGGLGELFDLGALLESLPSLLGGFLTGQEFGPFELPATDLSTTIPNIPPGTTFGLGNLQVRPQSGYAILGGDLE